MEGVDIFSGQQTFNRTSLESKQEEAKADFDAREAFNRTGLEVKQLAVGNYQKPETISLVIEKFDRLGTCY